MIEVRYSETNDINDKQLDHFETLDEAVSFVKTLPECYGFVICNLV